MCVLCTKMLITAVQAAQPQITQHECRCYYLINLQRAALITPPMPCRRDTPLQTQAKSFMPTRSFMEYSGKRFKPPGCSYGVTPVCKAVSITVHVGTRNITIQHPTGGVQSTC